MTITTSPAALSDKLADAHAALVSGIENLISSNTWETYLATQARFHRYSLHNVLWLMAQAWERKVEVTQFAGFNTWKDQGRFVRKGETSFKVLAPCTYKKANKETGEESWGVRGFKVVSVFDVSQTDGKGLPEIVQNLVGMDETARAMFEKLAAWSAAQGVVVDRSALPAGVNGVFRRDLRTISVSETLSDIHALKTLVHEVAHSILHATDEGDSRATKEIEAESTAFVTLHALGIPSEGYSFGYVAVWSNGKVDTVRDVAVRVQRTAKQILDILS